MANKYQTLKSECRTLGLDITGTLQVLEDRINKYHVDNQVVLSNIIDNSIISPSDINIQSDIIKPHELDRESLYLDAVQSTMGSHEAIARNIIMEKSHDDDELLQQIVYYAEQLLVSLEGIFIGGHAAQTRDQLFEVLCKYKNGENL